MLQPINQINHQKLMQECRNVRIGPDLDAFFDAWSLLRVPGSFEAIANRINAKLVR